jgi:hypothetical protein
MQKTQNLSVRFDTETYNAIQLAVAQEDTTPSHVIRRYLRDGLRRAGYLNTMQGKPVQPATTSADTDWE